MYGDVLDRLADRKSPRSLAGATAERPGVQESGLHGVVTLEQSDAPLSEQPRVKATFYLSREDVLVIDRLQSNAFMETGKKPERSQIVSQALQMLAGYGKS